MSNNTNTVVCRGCGQPAHLGHRCDGPFKTAASPADLHPDQFYTVDALCGNCGASVNGLRIKKGAPVSQRACECCGCSTLKLKPVATL